MNNGNSNESKLFSETVHLKVHIPDDEKSRERFLVHRGSALTSLFAVLRWSAVGKLSQNAYTSITQPL